MTENFCFGSCVLAVIYPSIIYQDSYLRLSQICTTSVPCESCRICLNFCMLLHPVNFVSNSEKNVFFGLPADICNITN